MNIVHVGGVIPVVGDHVFPEAPLAYAALATPRVGGGAVLEPWPRAREERLLFPSCREITVVRGQRPKPVHMVRQHDSGVDAERPAPSILAHGGAEGVDLHHQRGVPPIKEVDREEAGASGNPDTTIVRHTSTVAPGPVARQGDPGGAARRRIARAYPPYLPFSLDTNGVPNLTRRVSSTIHPAKPAPTLAEHFVRFTVGLRAMLARRSGADDPLRPLMWVLTQRVGIIRRRFDRLLALFQAGALPPPRKRPVRKPRPDDAPAKPPRKESIYPRGAGWLGRIVPPHPEIVYHGRAYGHMLRLLLADPHAEALLKAAPQLVRDLRPIAPHAGRHRHPRPATAASSAPAAAPAAAKIAAVGPVHAASAHRRANPLADRPRPESPA